MAEKIYHLLLIDIIALRGHQSLKRLIYIRSLDRAYLFSPPPGPGSGSESGLRFGAEAIPKLEAVPGTAAKKPLFACSIPYFFCFATGIP